MKVELRFRSGVLQSETVTGPAGTVELLIPTTGTYRVLGLHRGRGEVIAAVEGMHARIGQYELDAVPWPEGVEQFRLLTSALR
ncbi:hypothetical protein [Micromonospora aurantiaca (nom. illeg.)]|uniref:hypothetical protein n=1 Tax=Micromonospora aurantiaca (nom. illeg.) TaxID=47850 RepID=UPI0034084DA4